MFTFELPHKKAIIKTSENVPCLIRYSEAVRRDHMFLEKAHNLPPGSIITYNKGYVYYAKYENGL